MGNIKAAELLLEKGADAEVGNFKGVTALHLAIEQPRNRDIWKILFKKRLNVDFKDEDKTTPLHQAVKKGNDEIVGLLLEIGADIEARDKNGETPLFYAVSRSRHSGYHKVLDILLEKGSNVNTVDESGATVLHHAAKSGSGSVTLRLIKHGANIKARDSDGLTALQLARGKASEHEWHAELLRELWSRKDRFSRPGMALNALYWDFFLLFRLFLALPLLCRSGLLLISSMPRSLGARFKWRWIWFWVYSFMLGYVWNWGCYMAFGQGLFSVEKTAGYFLAWAWSFIGSWLYSLVLAKMDEEILAKPYTSISHMLLLFSRLDLAFCLGFMSILFDWRKYEEQAGARASFCDWLCSWAWWWRSGWA
jgi:ankyrin repeat protein